MSLKAPVRLSISRLDPHFASGGSKRADLAHVGQRSGERVDRAGECTGQPDAREAGQGERRKRDEKDRPARLAQRRRGGFVDRVEDVDAGVRLAQQFADRILGAADPRDSGQGQAPQRGGVQLRRHRVRQRRGQHLRGGRDQGGGTGERRELARVLAVQRGGQLEATEDIVLQHDVRAGQPEAPGRQQQQARRGGVPIGAGQGGGPACRQSAGHGHRAPRGIGHAPGRPA